MGGRIVEEEVGGVSEARNQQVAGVQHRGLARTRFATHVLVESASGGVIGRNPGCGCITQRLYKARFAHLARCMAVYLPMPLTAGGSGYFGNWSSLVLYGVASYCTGPAHRRG